MPEAIGGEAASSSSNVGNIQMLTFAASDHSVVIAKCQAAALAKAGHAVPRPSEQLEAARALKKDAKKDKRTLNLQ